MAFAPATQLEAVEALYIGYFGRAGEPGGVQFWIDQLQAGQTFAQVAAAFSVQAEAKAQHPFLANPDLVSPSDFVESLYVQLLGRASDAAGKAYWVGQLTAASGNAFSVGILIAQFISGAQGDDVTVLQNKVDAAEYFTGKLAAAGITGTDSKGQVTPQVDAAATDVVGGVTKDPASVTAANGKTDAFVSGGGGGGTIFTFTNQVDNLNGTPGNDTFIGDNTSTSAADTANGGSGNDTVKLFGLDNATLPQMNGIENVYFGNSVSPLGFDIFPLQGQVSNAELDNVFNGTSLKVGAGQSVKLSNLGVANVTISGNTVSSLNLTLNSDGAAGAGTSSGVTLTGTALATLNLTGVGNASFINNTFNGGGALKTVNIDGGSKITLNNALTGVTTIDASKATVGTSVLIDTGLAVKFTGGAGNDTVDIGNAGIGATDSLDGAGGTGDILRSAQTVSAANGTGIKGFETFQATAALVQDFDDLAANNTFTNVLTTALAANVTFNDIQASAINNINVTTDFMNTLTLTGKGFIAGGISDTATVKFNNIPGQNGVNVLDLNFANVDVLTLNSLSTGTVTGINGGTAFNAANLTADDLDVLNITGNEAFSVGLNAATSSLTVIDASTNTGGVFINAGAPAIVSLNVKGSNATGATFGDTLFVNNAATGATIEGGKGGDAIVVESTVADVLKYLAGDSSTGASNFDTVNGFTLVSGSTIDVSGIGGFTGSQATILNRTEAGATTLVNTGTLAVNAAAAANFFVDLGNINRGVVVIDLDGTGGANSDWAVYVDSNHNGAFDTGDLALRVNNVGAGPWTAAEFTFA